MATTWPPPTIGDIVWCRFPEQPQVGAGHKPRPALVIKVEIKEDGTDVTVVYGTSKRVRNLTVGEFAILGDIHPAAYSLAGLAADTKFDFKRTITLPWTDEFFQEAPRSNYGRNPKLGVLHAAMVRPASTAHKAAEDRESS